MKFFTGQKAITKIERQVYTGSKSTLTDLGVTNTCYLRPMAEEQSSANGIQYGLGFWIIVEINVDIREGDRVTVDSVVYTIRGVVNHDRGGITAYKRCLALKPEN